MNNLRTLKEAFDAHQTGPYDLYRDIYRHIPCGPSMGLQIEVEEPVEEDGIGPLHRTATKWLYCDALRQLGTWADMESQCIWPLAISVGSIVEGVDYDCDTIEIEIEDKTSDQLAHEFWLATGQVNEQADQIWKETHGCDTCALHWASKLGVALEDMSVGDTPIWEDCPNCEGLGAVI